MKFERLEYLFTKDGLKKLENATVAIIGLGGVGGTAAITLARSGVGNLIICDFDRIEETNINRQIIANTNNIGFLKTDVLEKLILEINPNCKLTKITNKYNGEIFIKDDLYVIDAIDDIKGKINLIEDCLKRKLTFISSMGAAKKVDPKMIEVTKISKTTYDPIAKILRKHFKGFDFPVVSSTESPRIAKLGSYMPVTSTFGLYLSDFIVKEILKKGE